MAKILIVEDDEGCRVPLQVALARDGHVALAVASCDAALEAAQTTAFDLVIVDWMLGEARDGLELLHGLRELHPELQAIVISGYPVVGLEDRVRDLAGCQFLAKPFTFAQVLAAIDAAAVARAGGWRKKH